MDYSRGRYGDLHSGNRVFKLNISLIKPYLLFVPATSDILLVVTLSFIPSLTFVEIILWDFSFDQERTNYGSSLKKKTI